MTQDERERVRAAIAALHAELEAMILDACPGPHTYVQHRDRKRPWCNACGCDRFGQPVGRA